MTKMLHIYRPRWFQRTWFGVNRPSSCRVPASARFQEPLSHPWIHPLSPHGQMTITLHIDRLRWFQWTWFQVNRPSGCWVLASARFQKPLLQIPGALVMPMSTAIWPQRASDHDVVHLETETVPMNLIWSESAQGLLSYRPDAQRNGRRPIHSPSFFLRKGRGTIILSKLDSIHQGLSHWTHLWRHVIFCDLIALIL